MACVSATCESRRAINRKHAKPLVMTVSRSEADVRPDDEVLCDDESEIELDDISELLEAMDITAEADMEGATAWEASQLTGDVEKLRQSFSALKQKEQFADASSWKRAFGEQAEVTELVDASLELEDGEDGFEFVTL